MIVDIVFGAGIDGIVNFHNRGLVTASVTIVGCREDSDDGSVVLPLITLHDQLVGSGNEI